MFNNLFSDKPVVSSRFISNFVIGCIVSGILTGCACSDSSSKGTKISDQVERLTNDIAMTNVNVSDKTKKIVKAMAFVKPTKGNNVRGKVTFTKVNNGIKIVADFEGLKPGKHGFHIHEFGDCGDDGAAAGAHFNPTHKEHGSPDTESRHVGDLGNLVADASGFAHYERIDKEIAFEGDNSIIGRSIIVHADEDDFKTQPAGASGAKIACGIIEASAY